MQAQHTKATMSVHEMRDLLGIGKTESYWLVKKRLFQVDMINNKMRIVLSSFEEWYDHQTRYQKITGQEPGCKLRAESLSIHEIAELFELSDDSTYELIRRVQLKTVVIHHLMRVPRADFMAWYAGQTRYRLPEDRTCDKAKEDGSLSLPEIARLLGVSREIVYYHVQHAESELAVITVADRKRVTKDSFERWYENRYGSKMKLDYTHTEVRKRKTPAHRQETQAQLAAPVVPIIKELYTIQEAAILLRMEERDVYRLIERNQLRARKAGGRWRISQQAVQRWFADAERVDTEGEV